MPSNLTIFFVYCILSTITEHISAEDTVSARIVNGDNVTNVRDRPFQVSLQNGRHFCGGSIITKYYVLTAAHSVVDKRASEIQIYAGTVDLKKPNKIYEVSKVIIHESFYRPQLRNDIALVKVATPFTFSNVIQPIRLPKPDMTIRPETPATISGWGRFLDCSERPNILQKAVVHIVDQKTCQTLLSKEKYQVRSTQICATDLDTSIRRGSCNGDSGGPMTVKGVLVGIISYSIKDPSYGSTEYPEVETRVSKYIDWIRKNVK